MPPPKDYYSGMCRECGHWKADLFRSFCGDCRKEYGKRKNREEKASKKGGKPHRGKLQSRQSVGPPPDAYFVSTPYHDEKVNTDDWITLYNRVYNMMNGLLQALHQSGFSDEEIQSRFDWDGHHADPLDEYIKDYRNAFRELQ